MTFPRLRIFFSAFLLTLWTTLAQAQNATLLADSVIVNGNSSIEAVGNVEVLYQDTRLKASRIIYNGDDGTLQIEGPITLIEGEKSYLLAESAEMSTDLRDGILHGARLVLDQQLQLAATEIAHVNGRYTQLYQTVASSCQVCAANPVPLWKIRARKVIHDQEEQQLYFEDATFMLANVPVFYLPRLRLPGPALKRATGFLTPRYSASTILGQGIKVPYFVKIGRSADLTFTPFISSKTRTLEARYRQVFGNGNIQFNGALSFDDLTESQSPRGFLYGRGRFNLPYDFKLTFGIELTSDPTYLRDYDYSDRDRLENNFKITRTRNNATFRAELLGVEPVYGPDLSRKDQLPNVQANLFYEKRFFPSVIGGQGSLEFSLEGYKRESDVNRIGRDGTRVGARLNWSRNEMFGPGILARFGGTLGAELYGIKQDTRYAESQVLIRPGLEVELSWPLVRSGKGGIAMTLEPVVQLAWSESYGGDVPNEDSTLVEFDRGNLFALSRFPGEDRYEHGFRAATGIKWSRYDPTGWSMDVTLGRVFRSSANNAFSRASGLNGQNSNWLATTQIKFDNDLSIIARAQIDDQMRTTKAETRAVWKFNKVALAASHTWIIADIRENRPLDTQQVAFDSSFPIGRNWETNFDIRYDFVDHTPTRSRFGIRYVTECISIDLSASRRFATSTNVTPDTKFGFAVSLLGFGSTGRADRRTCSG